MVELKSMENSHEDMYIVTDKNMTEAAIDAAYAELAADQRREAEERQAIDAALRKSSRRIRPRNAGIDGFGNPIQGMWNVVLSTSEPYERPYERGVGLFHDLASAESYCDAFDNASQIAAGKTVNQFETTYCRIEFIPFGERNPVFHTLYTMETERDMTTGHRTITEARAEVISEKELLKIVTSGTDPRLAAIWEDKSLAVSLDNRSEESSQEVISSEIFGPVEIVTGEHDDGTPYSYPESVETFLTFSPANVVLKNPNNA